MIRFKYYPFGMLQPSRKYSAGDDYKYGFNRKEISFEININYYDFGARIYDSRIARWFSVDPLMSKYPKLSPYIFTANNPILFIDLDGKDYGIYVDHNTKTVTIKATYYTVKGDDATNAHLGAKKWNAETGKWQMVYFTGERYDIKFELTVKEFDDAAKRDAAFTADKSGEGNKFVSSPPNPARWGNTKSENGGGINSVDVENSAAAQARFTPAHEMGHTLGLFHFNDGLMEDGATRPAGEADNQITLGMVSRILNNAGLSNVVEKATDKQIVVPAWVPRAKVTVHEIGISPMQKLMKKKLEEDLKKFEIKVKDNLGGPQGAYPPPKPRLSFDKGTKVSQN